MASVVKTDNGKYRTFVFVEETRRTKTFRTKREAEAWGAATETELRSQLDEKPSDRHTLRELLVRYSEEVSPTKRGGAKEAIRIQAMLKGNLPVDRRLSDITPEAIGIWRDELLRTVTPGSVLRYLGLLSSVFEAARREWRWIEINPVRDIRKPRAPDHRTVTLTRHQIRMMLLQLGYSPLRPVRTVSQSVAVTFLMALRTGMRAGELCGLTWDRVFEHHCSLPVTKTVPRDVPLTLKAMRLVERMRGFDDKMVFGLKSQTLDALFRRARDRAGLSGFTFHDSRHTAATWLARALDVLDLCKVFGWSNPAQAMVYYNPKAKDIAKRMARREKASGSGQ